MKYLKFVLMFVLFSLLLAGCTAIYGEPVDFFRGYGWEELLGLFFAALFGLFPGFKLFDWLKAKFGLEGQAAHWMVLGASVILTVVAMLVTGFFDLSGFELTLGNILEYGLLIYAASQIAYKRFKEARSANR